MSKNPLLFVGKGVHLSRAYEEVKELSQQYGIPIVTTPGGKGTVRSDHPGYLGPFGLGGTEEAANYLKLGVDLLLVIGTKLSDMSLAGFTPEMYPERMIHFDINPGFIGKSIPCPTLAIIGDIKENLKLLLSNHSKLDHRDGYFHQNVSAEIRKVNPNQEYISARSAVQALRELLPPESILFGDDGSHTFYAIRYFDILQEGTFFFDDIFGSMGNGICYSIGAKMASPQVPVVCLTGDGCTLMHGTEISTAVCQHVPVIFVVLNNGRIDMVDKGMRYSVGHAVGTVYESPVNIQLLAESLGAASFKCTTEVEIKKALTFALKHEGPTVIEIMVDPEEIPPTMNRG